MFDNLRSMALSTSDADALALATRVRPTSARSDRLLPVPVPLAGLLPGGGLQRGTVVAVESPGGRLGPRCEPGEPDAGGATTLSFALLTAASAAGSWCAVVGMGDPGLVSVAELGADLDRLALVPHPGRAWAEVTAALIDGMDVVLLFLPWPARPGVARRLVARARERQSVLIVEGYRPWWPEGPEVRLTVTSGSWEGVGRGHGHLRGRRVEILSSGRRVASRPRAAALWLPGPTGSVERA